MIATAMLVVALAAGDKQFVDRAVLMNDTTLQRAEAAESSADNYVLDYIEEVWGDRRSANQQLEAAAKSAGYTSASEFKPQSGAPSTSRPATSRLPSSQTAAFGVQYFKVEVAADREALTLYAGEAKSGSDASLREYARSFEPKLQGELTNATHDLAVEQSLQRGH